MEKNNLLFEPQREKAGSQTFSKYSYQYHWALCRILKEHNGEKEYAVFVELHEDVVLSNSLSVNDAQFEFSQIKTNQTKFTKNNIIKLKNGSSVLGKLIDSTLNKKYTERIIDINLVASSGFTAKDFKEEGIFLDKISISEIPSTTIEHLVKEISSELNIKSLPTNLYFITSDVPDIGFQEFTLGKITTLISELFPKSLTQAENIYRPLIEELNRKGMVTVDFKNWDEVLKNKALTSITVSKLIHQFTERQDDKEVYSQLNDFLIDLKLKTMQRSKWKKSFKRYYLNRIANKTLEQLEIQDEIQKQLDECDEEIEILIQLVYDNLPISIRKNFQSDIDIKTAIICEYILGELSNE